MSVLRAQWDRVAAWAATALGVILLIVGYFKVSGTPFPAEQVPYLASAGLGALFLLGLAGSLWISADLRDEYAKLDEIARSLAALEARSAPDAELDEDSTDMRVPPQAGTRARAGRMTLGAPPAADPPAAVVETLSSDAPDADAPAADAPPATSRRRVRPTSRV